MKKLLTVSLFAIMAVSAANADIASTDYVTTRTGDMQFSDDGITKDATNLTEAVVALDTNFSVVSNGIAGQIESALEPVNEEIEGLGGRVQAIEGSDYAKSGITSTKVAAYDAYATTIAANTAAASKAQGEVDALEETVAGLDSTYATDGQLSSAVTTLEGKISEAQTAATYDDTEVRGLITANANDIDAIEQSAYATSGVTAAVVGQVTTNKNDITAINNSDVMKSGVDSDVVAKANSAMQETALKGLATWTSQGCATGTCSLVSKNGSIAWEKVSY